MRYTDLITYEVMSNEWTSFVEFTFDAPIVASETDVIDAIYKKTFYGPEDELYIDRVGTNAVKPNFYVYRLGYSGILYTVRPKESE